MTGHDLCNELKQLTTELEMTGQLSVRSHTLEALGLASGYATLVHTLSPENSEIWNNWIQQGLARLAQQRN